VPVTPDTSFAFDRCSTKGAATRFPAIEAVTSTYAMSERVRLSYLYARTVVGRDFAQPAVEPADLH